MSKQISKRNRNSDDSADDSKPSDIEASSSSSDSSQHHNRCKRKRKLKKHKQDSCSENDSDSSESTECTDKKKRKKSKKRKTNKVKEVVEVERRNEVLYVSSDDGKAQMKRMAVENGDLPEKSTTKWGRSSDDDYRNKRRDWKHESPGRQQNNFYNRENKKNRFDHEKHSRNNLDEKKYRFNEREHDESSYINQKRIHNRDSERRDIRRDFRYNNDDNRGRYKDRNKNFNDYRRNDTRSKKPDDQWKNRDGNNERFKFVNRTRPSERIEHATRRDQYRRPRNDEADHQTRPEREDNWDRRNDSWDDQNRQNDRDNDRRNTKIKSEKERRLDWGLPEDSKPKAEVEKEKPNFGLSGKLTEETNKVNGIVIKYAEPAEARKPKRRWRLYPFKGEQSLPTLYIHRQSCYLIGRDRKICDLPVDHPSCSKQHAVLQYRLVPFEREDGSVGKRVRPYVIDLESANGTFINNKKVEGKKYIELLEKDVLKFGFSSREYVILHENSKDEDEDDDVVIE